MTSTRPDWAASDVASAAYRASSWEPLYTAGGIAAILAALLFRRNIGAEVSLFTGIEAIPQSVAGWYALLHEQPLIGLSFLGLFDLANGALVAVVFLALGVALWQAHRSAATVAGAAGLVGIAVGFASNISLTMLSLSRQFAAAPSRAEQTTLLSAGQAALAANNPHAIYPATGAYISLLLIAVAGLLFASAMLRHSRATAVAGLIACGCDLTYCLTVFFAPSLRALLLAAGGLFWMIWHLLVARQLLLRRKG